MGLIRGEGLPDMVPSPWKCVCMCDRQFVSKATCLLLYEKLQEGGGHLSVSKKMGDKRSSKSNEWEPGRNIDR